MYAIYATHGVFGSVTPGREIRTTNRSDRRPLDTPASPVMTRRRLRQAPTATTCSFQPQQKLVVMSFPGQIQRKNLPLFYQIVFFLIACLLLVVHSYASSSSCFSSSSSSSSCCLCFIFLVLLLLLFPALCLFLLFPACFSC